MSKGPFFSTPTTMAKWKRKYVVLGGPIAKKNVLQVRIEPFLPLTFVLPPKPSSSFH